MKLATKVVVGIVLFEIADHLYPRLGAADWLNWPAALVTVALIVLALRTA